jgi:hypothetical protein
LLAKHYSPKAKVHLLKWTSESELRRKLDDLGVKPGDCWIVAYHHIPTSGAFPHVCVIPDDPESYARALYG